MSELIERVARAMCLSCDVDPDYVSDGKIMWHRFDKDARAAIAAVAEFLCLEAARSASPAQAHEYLSATFLKKQLEQSKND